MVKISDETYERLRRILEEQNGHSYTPEEAKEIGNGLIDFFSLLLELDNGATLQEPISKDTLPAC
jgi:hypothetical protein